MKEYIERSSLKEEILSWCVLLNKPHLLSKDDTMHVIDNMPAADVAPVVHGRWDTTETPLGTCCVCSVCRSCPTMEYNYCPYCGALMDLE